MRNLSAPAWNGWGADYQNSRSQPASAAGLSPGQVSRLQLKWAFGFPGATALYGQTVVGGRVYTTSNAGYVYSLDAATGCVHRAYHSQAVVRSGFSVGTLSPSSDRLGIFFGDIHGQAYALDASTGEVIWTVQTDPHPLARITGMPVLHDGRVYVPVASLEEPESGQADYTCCTFRGVLAALDVARLRTSRAAGRPCRRAEEARRGGRGTEVAFPASRRGRPTVNRPCVPRLFVIQERA